MPQHLRRYLVGAQHECRTRFLRRKMKHTSLLRSKIISTPPGAVVPCPLNIPPPSCTQLLVQSAQCSSTIGLAITDLCHRISLYTESNHLGTTFGVKPGVY